MSAKIDYTRTVLTFLKSQIVAKQNALGSLLAAIGQAEALLNSREAFQEDPKKVNIVSKFTAMETAVNQVNGLLLSIPTQSDFMAGYDAATDPE